MDDISSIKYFIFEIGVLVNACVFAASFLPGLERLLLRTLFHTLLIFVFCLVVYLLHLWHLYLFCSLEFVPHWFRLSFFTL